MFENNILPADVVVRVGVVNVTVVVVVAIVAEVVVGFVVGTTAIVEVVNVGCFVVVIPEIVEQFDFYRIGSM